MEFLRGVKLQPMRRKVLDNCLEVFNAIFDHLLALNIDGM